MVRAIAALNEATNQRAAIVLKLLGFRKTVFAGPALRRSSAGHLIESMVATLSAPIGPLPDTVTTATKQQQKDAKRMAVMPRHLDQRPERAAIASHDEARR